jgi:uncharacterized protein YhaN
VNTGAGTGRELRLVSVHAELFGGLRDRHVKIGDDPFVVIHGDNEAGKTSLSTLLGWLLVGTSGDAAFSQRFGTPGTVLRGSLEATLAGENVNATGAFSVGLKGKPNNKQLVITWRGAAHSIEAWRTAALHGLDDVELDAVYRMQGVTLHNDPSVIKQIAGLVMTGMPGAVHPGEVLGSLDKRVAAALTTSAGGQRSFKVVAKEATAAHRGVEALRSGARDYLEHERLLNETRAEAERLVGLLAEAREQQSAHTKVLAVEHLRVQAADLNRQLAELESVDEGWARVVALRTQLQRAVPAVIEQADACEQAASKVEAARRGLGLSADDARGIQVTDAVRSAVESADRKLERQRDNVTQADTKVTEATASLVAAEDALRQAVQDLPIDRDGVRAVVLDAGTRGSIVAALDVLKTAEANLQDARSKHDEAVAKVATQESESRAAREACDHLGIGGDLDRWNGGDGPHTATSKPPLATAVVILLAAATAVAALAGAPRLVAAGLAAAASVAGVVALVRQRAQRGAVAEGGPVATDIADAVKQARDAVAVVRSGRNELERCVAALDAAQTRVTEASDAATSAAAAAGYPSEGGYTAQHAVYEAIDAARRCLGEVERADDALVAARVQRDDAAHAVDAAERELEGLVRDAGVPASLAWDRAVACLDDLRNLTALCLDLDAAAASLATSESALAELLVPVADVVAGLSPAEVLEQCTTMAELASQRADLVKDRRNLEAQIDVGVGTSTAARELADRRLPAEVLDAAVKDGEHEVARLEEELENVRADAVRIEEFLGAAAKRDELARLQLGVGVLEESMDALVIDAAVARFAAVVLAEVAEEQRRLRQPELITRAGEMLRTVAPRWQEILIEAVGSGHEVVVRRDDGVLLPFTQLSTGTQALVYLALRLSAAEQDAERRGGLRLPFICDDPLMSLDGPRAKAAAGLLAQTAARGHQVLVFTCHERTAQDAAAVGAAVRQL